MSGRGRTQFFSPGAPEGAPTGELKSTLIRVDFDMEMEVVVDEVFAEEAEKSAAGWSGGTHFPPSISARTMSASCLAVGSFPFSSPGSFDCKA